MLNARFVPLESWPGKPTLEWNRRDSLFSASYTQTLDLLETELEKINAKEVLIQAFFTRDQLRNDGWPKGNAEPSEVGVIVSFDSPKGPLSFPCDTFTTFDSNLRAITLALQALRAVDRYGVTQGAEQYKGWARLPAPADHPFRNKEEAAAFLVSQANADRADFASSTWVHAQNAVMNHGPARDGAYKAAAKKLHPDANGGSHEMFVRLQAAMKLLEAQ